jgi:hypothetical protein
MSANLLAKEIGIGYHMSMWSFQFALDIGRFSWCGHGNQYPDGLHLHQIFFMFGSVSWN